MSEISSEDDVVYVRAARGVRLRTPPDRVSDVAVCMALEPECESPSMDAESVPRYERVDVTMFVPEPEVISIDSSERKPVPDRVSVQVPVSPRVKEDVVERKLDVGVRVLGVELALKNTSSETELAVSEPRLLRSATLGGGDMYTFPLSRGPLDTVTGDPSPTAIPPARPRPKPNPGRLSRARRSADANSSSRSVRELVLRRELLRLGGITRGSPGYRYPCDEIAPSSVARVWWAEARDGRRDSPLDPERDWMSESSSRGGTYTVDADPVPELEVAVLDMDWMVRTDPVGERVLDLSGTETARSSTSLLIAFVTALMA